MRDQSTLRRCVENEMLLHGADVHYGWLMTGVAYYRDGWIPRRAALVQASSDIFGNNRRHLQVEGRIIGRGVFEHRLAVTA